VEEGSEIVGISSDDIDDVDAEASEANRNTNCPARNVDDTAREPVVVHRDKLTLAEFMRVNMRLAEDRVLSFVSVFASGMGTKWVTGASFSYQPECRFQSLLTQRRR
jgi:cellulose synthase/poly-beta-1,6-N-acetylglucosamine synthase-like glycosyltransferase